MLLVTKQTSASWRYIGRQPRKTAHGTADFASNMPNICGRAKFRVSALKKLLLLCSPIMQRTTDDGAKSASGRNAPRGLTPFGRCLIQELSSLSAPIGPSLL